MGSALSAGVSGLKCHQTMLDVAGNNLANVNTVGFKGSSVTFAELLSQTIRRASGPSSSLGGESAADGQRRRRGLNSNGYKPGKHYRNRTGSGCGH